MRVRGSLCAAADGILYNVVSAVVLYLYDYGPSLNLYWKCMDGGNIKCTFYHLFSLYSWTSITKAAAAESSSVSSGKSDNVHCNDLEE